MKKILLWLRIIRPQTLPASLVPVLVGLLCSKGIETVAYYPALTAVLTIICALSLQILSNLVNDYYDFVRGSDKAGRAGFKRALAEGEVSKRQMACACLTALAVALASGLFLVLAGGWPILLVGVSAIVFAWLYTATSHSLSYLGIADIFVFLYYGVIASAGTVYLLTQVLSLKAFYAGAVCGLISMCVLMINNLRDYESDLVAGKRTIPVRFGKRTGEILMLIYVILMPVFAYQAFGSGSLAGFIACPAFALWINVTQAKGVKYNKCLLTAGILNVLYFLLILL